jgi:hypothetical protein
VSRLFPKARAEKHTDDKNESFRTPRMHDATSRAKLLKTFSSMIRVPPSRPKQFSRSNPLVSTHTLRYGI